MGFGVTFGRVLAGPDPHQVVAVFAIKSRSKTVEEVKGLKPAGERCHVNAEKIEAEFQRWSFEANNNGVSEYDDSNSEWGKPTSLKLTQ